MCVLVSGEDIVSMPKVQSTLAQVPTQMQATPTDVVAGGLSKDVGCIEGPRTIIIKRGRGAAKTLDLYKLQVPLQRG